MSTVPKYTKYKIYCMIKGILISTNPQLGAVLAVQ
jgi:hypothetical protein